MRWYFPSWSGDFRLVAPESEPTYRDNGSTVVDASVLVVTDPSPNEVDLLNKFLDIAAKKDWIGHTKSGWRRKRVPEKRVELKPGEQRFSVRAAVGDAGAELARILKPKSSITAVRFTNGVVEVAEQSELLSLASKLARRDEPPATKPAPKAVATVARPTPCCPQCIPGSIDPAREVLLEFLDEQQHADWAEARCLIAYGGLTGHRYLIAHRHSETAARIGRICYDLDDNQVVHFHDQSVPPEEEVLAAKLVLEHREPWLRNEATMLGGGRDVFKNPFGDSSDGAADSGLTGAIGLFAAAVMKRAEKSVDP